MEDLKPIEKLYLLSLEKENAWTNKLKLTYLIYQLLENDNLDINKNKLRVHLSGKDFNTDYENQFLDLLLQNDYVNLNNFIKNLRFDRLLVKKDYLTNKVENVKFLFLNFNKNKVSKTIKYHQAQIELLTLIKDQDIKELFITNINLKPKMVKVYNNIKESLTVKKKDKKDDMGKTLSEVFS